MVYGIESKMELPFTPLHQVCGPMLDHLERLPPPQREALRIVFGLSGGSAAGGRAVASHLRIEERELEAGGLY